MSNPTEPNQTTTTSATSASSASQPPDIYERYLAALEEATTINNDFADAENDGSIYFTQEKHNQMKQRLKALERPDLKKLEEELSKYEEGFNDEDMLTDYQRAQQSKIRKAYSKYRKSAQRIASLVFRSIKGAPAYNVVPGGKRKTKRKQRKQKRKSRKH